MRFVYATDLHGDEEKYHKALDLCAKSGAGLLHLGADLLPKGYSMQPRQKDFLKKFLPTFYKECRAKGVEPVGMFGNDDLWTNKPLYRDRCGDPLDEAVREHGGFLFSAYPYVPDYPFGLKTACKYDHKGWKPEPYISEPVEVTHKGFEPILNVKAYFKDKGTIEDDLKERGVAENEVVALHSPPLGTDLDVCIDGRVVGSRAILEWIKEKQPYMVLCGHIHESPWATGRTSAKIGRTFVLQPGQYLSSASVPFWKHEEISKHLDKNPWADIRMLRAAVVDIDLGSEPKVKIEDL